MGESTSRKMHSRPAWVRHGCEACHIGGGCWKLPGVPRRSAKSEMKFQAAGGSWNLDSRLCLGVHCVDPNFLDHTKGPDEKNLKFLQRPLTQKFHWPAIGVECSRYTFVTEKTVHISALLLCQFLPLAAHLVS